MWILAQISPSNAAVIPSGWRAPLLGVALLFPVLIGAYWGTVAAMVNIWLHSATFAHALLIVPIALYLIWRRRASLLQHVPCPSGWASLLVLGAGMVWLLAYAIGVNAAQQMAWMALIPATLWMLWGAAAVRVIAFPLGYLFFAVPFGDFLVAPLQDVTAAFTVWALQLTGIPVLWEGRFFYIPSGSFEVAEACSGARYLIASLALGTLYAYLSYHSLRRRIAFIALAALVPIVANGLRAYGIVMLAHLSDYRLAVGVDHFIYGWAFFGLVMLLLFWIGNQFRDAPGPHGSPETTRDAPPAIRGALHWIGWTFLAAGLIVSAPLLAWARSHAAAPPVVLQLPPGEQGWEGPLATEHIWRPLFPRAGAQQRAEYRKAGKSVYVFVARYGLKTPEAELISTENLAFDSKLGRRLSEDDIEVSLTPGAWPVHATRIQWAHGSTLLWHWYEIGNYPVTSPIAAKLHEARASLFGSDSGSAVIMVAADYVTGPDQAAGLLKEFLGTMLAPLRAGAGSQP